jgi:Ras-related protein Rab-1A
MTIFIAITWLLLELISKLNKIHRSGKDVTLNIWDTGGQERFKSITKSYYNGAHGIALVYDWTSEESFRNITKWLQTIEEWAWNDVVKVLVANKSDKDSISVPIETGNDFADENNLHFFEWSAKTGLNIHEIFEKVRIKS